MSENTQSLRSIQEKWLMDCLRRNGQCEYARLYRFDEINSIEAFRTSVPLVDYEILAPFIERIAAGEADVLFNALPVAFEMTGGSSGGGKLFPYTAETFKDFQRALLPWLGTAFHKYGISHGKGYWAISPALRTARFTNGGIKIGVEDEAYLGESARGAFADSAAVPSWVGELNNFDEWLIATLYWLLRADSLELISVWSPTFLLMLLDGLEKQSGYVARLLEEGGQIGNRHLDSDNEAFERFQIYLRTRDYFSLWPELKLISCWKDGTSRPYYERLVSRFSFVSFQPKGLVSTEAAVTIPDYEDRPVLTAESGFYEFLKSDGECVFAHELLKGEAYEVVLTTSGGLYRYRSGDQVSCEGYAGMLPILRFIGRCGIVSDMVGEKLTDAFVKSAFQPLTGFAMLIPIPDEVPYYLLVTDEAADTEGIDIALGMNPQYAYARSLGQLGNLRGLVVHDATQRYIRYQIDAGKRAGDIKIPALQPDGRWLNMLQGWYS